LLRARFDFVRISDRAGESKGKTGKKTDFARSSCETLPPSADAQASVIGGTYPERGSPMLFNSWLRNLKSWLANGKLRRRTIARKQTARPYLEALEDRTCPTHFRYGTISWEPVTGKEISFNLEQSWRRDYPWQGLTPSNPVLPNVGDTVDVGHTLVFGEGGAQAEIMLHVDSVNATQDYFVGHATITHTYSTSGNFIAYMESAARLSALVNNPDDEFRNETLVDVGAGNDSAVSALAPIVQVPQGATYSFQIPAADPDGDNLTYRLSTSAEAGGSFGFVQPSQVSINSSGLVTWNGTGTIVGQLYSVQFMVEDHATVGGPVLSKIPLDLILQVSNASHAAPTVAANPTGPFTTVANTSVGFTVTAHDSNAGSQIVELDALNAPAGMTFTSFTPGATSAITASWTPTGAQADHTYVITFQATDDQGATGLTSVTITVPPLPPTVTSPGDQTGTEGVASSFDLGSFSDPVAGPYSVDVNWGDGSPDDTFDVSGTSADNVSLGSLSHLFTEEGGQTVSVTVTNHASQGATQTFNVAVADAPVSVSLTDPAAINENDFATLPGSFTDTGISDTHTVTINWADSNSPANSTFLVPATNSLAPNQTVASSTDGATLTVTAVDTATGKVSFSVQHQYLDDGPAPGNGTPSDSYAITGTVQDDEGTLGSGGATVVVNNVAPKFANVAVTPINEFGVAHLTGDIVDPGTLDVHTLIVNWGDGSLPETFTVPAGVTSFDEAHPYGDVPSGNPQVTYPISLSVTDDDNFQITQPDFSTLANLTLSGNAQQLVTGDGAVVRLASATTNQAGSMFSTQKIDAAAGFSTNFAFRISNPGGIPDAAGQSGADGFTFVLQDQTNSPNSVGAGLGYAGLTPSVAVEFDTWMNAASNGFPSIADISTNHIGVDINGNVHSVVALDRPGPVERFDNGALHFVWIDYNGTTLDVRINDTADVRPALPTLSYNIDIPSILGQNKGFVGFTAATGAAWGDHDIVSWHFANTAADTDHSSTQVTVTDPDVVATGGKTFTVPEGSATLSNVVVATFSDPGDPTGTLEDAGDYAASIAWGDGVTDSGAAVSIVNNGDGTYSVVGSHTYTGDTIAGNSEGAATITVTVSHDGAATTPQTVTSSATITDPPVVATGGLSVSATEGATSASQVVATFVDPGGAEEFADYSATIDWGDNSSSGADQITYSNGVFSVYGSHNYAEESAADHPGSSPYQITVTVHHDNTDDAAPVISSATVADANVMATGGQAISSVEGASTGSALLATFTDPGGAEALGAYTADINWGDGGATQIGAGSITLNGSTYEVRGSHTYMEESDPGHPGSTPYQITVTINHETSTPQVVTSTATVSDAGLSATGKNIAGVACLSTLTVTVATFTDLGGPEGIGDYAATINWGGAGTGSTTGAIVANGDGSFSVQGSFTYNTEGVYTVAVHITHEHGIVADTTSTATIKDNIGILLLDRTSRGALTDTGNGGVDVTGCGAIIVDSSSTQAAIASGNGVVSADDIDAKGTVTNGHGAFVGTIDHNEAPEADPLAYLATPPVPTTVRSSSTLNISGGIVTLQPGLYVGGIKISGQAQVTLAPGLYYLKGGGFSVSGQATVNDNGQGVMLYNAPASSNDGISFSGQGAVNLSGMTAAQLAGLGLSAPQYAGYAGLAIYQDRTSTAVLSLSGQGNVNITGTIYAASATVKVTGNGSLDLTGSAAKKLGSHLIASDLMVTGNGGVNVDASDNNLELL
jgi:hypothetical protein